MNAPTDPDTTHRTAPLALWRVAEAFMHTLHMLFGNPEDVAADHTLRFEAHKLMASWLRCAEAILRRLLVIEASAFAKPDTRPLLLRSRKRAPKLMCFTPEHPEKWRVSFRCFGLPASSRQKKCRQDAGGSRFRSAWPLAERYEALLRVFNAPAAFARRLAARLHAAAHRLRELLRAPPEAHDRVDLFDALTAEAEAHGAIFNSG